MGGEESQESIVVRASEVGLGVFWVGQCIIHVEVLKGDAFRFDLLEIKCAQNGFIMAFRINNEVVYGGDASVFHDGIQGATRDGDVFKLEIGVAFLEVELVDVAIRRGGHLVQEEGMGIKIIVLARCDEGEGAVVIADCDVQEFNLIVADTVSVVVFQEVIQEGDGFNQDDVFVLHGLVINWVIVGVSNMRTDLEIVNVRGFVGIGCGHGWGCCMYVV